MEEIRDPLYLYTELLRALALEVARQVLEAEMSEALDGLMGTDC